MCSSCLALIEILVLLILVSCNKNIIERKPFPEDHAASDSRVQSKGQMWSDEDLEQVIVESVFDTMGVVMESEDLMNDPYSSVSLPDSVNVPDDIVEIAVSVEGHDLIFLINGLSITDVSQTHRGFNVSVSEYTRRLNGRSVKVTIKRLISKL